MSAPLAAIVVQDVAKSFKQRSGVIQALKGVSFEVPRGVVFSILGPNGAGKTTLLRILTTVMRPTQGTAVIEGADILKDPLAVRKVIGIVAQDNHFDKYLTVWHNLTLHAEMHGLTRAEYEPRIRELLERVGLYHRRLDYAEQLSGGQQRRVALIRALIHQPRVLFLDEPTTGLDPEARREIWQSIEDFKRFATVILTTHYMEEADRLSDELMILNNGQIDMRGTPRELKQRISPPNIYMLRFRHPVAAHYLPRLQAMGLAREVSQLSDDQLRLVLARPDDLRDILSRVDLADLHDVGLSEADLETVYLSVARQQEAAV